MVAIAIGVQESSTERLGVVVGAEMLLPATEEAKLLNWGLAADSPLFFVSLLAGRFWIPFFYLGGTLDFCRFENILVL